ncbi:box C/D snoRNA protein 1 [Notolabrus celidotus]|uniref:box C/D snoRNA protein 1 n=1 Tax=Notolabrus celidotus TaxID=1203425 RepID=UPI00148F7665|nr:box C/D snoRNA protein 1 [Notolabrus celidotus]
MCSAVIVQTSDIMSTVEAREENGDLEEKLRGTKRKISLSNCGGCGSGEAKYKCPACLAHSCSLLCVKKHKEESGCSGVRNKTAFVTLSQFDEMALLSDYRFLEDTGRFADGANRDSLVRTPRSTIKAKRLAANARKVNITLRFLPVTFTKSRENSTFFLSKERLFLWHVKLVFPQSSTEFSQRRVSEKQTLEEILTPYIHPTESDPVTRQKLKMYVHTPFDHVKVFMKAEGRKANSVRYHELDIHKTLRDNLSYKTLIEYPVLHVVLRDQWNNYPLKGPAEPATGRSRFATNSNESVQEKEHVTQVSPSIQGAYNRTGTNIWTGTPETSPEAEPPKQKRAKRETGDDDMEEGEIMDSSDEEEENSVKKESGDGAKRCVNDIRVIKDGTADSVDSNVDDSLAKHSDSSRDECVKMDVSASSDQSAARESAEVGMTKAVEELEPVRSPSLSG